MSGATLAILIIIGLVAGFLGGMIGLGGYLGSRLALNLPVGVLKKAFAVVLALIAAKMVFTK
jgi:uncharacterized membrane protein YfcA